MTVSELLPTLREFSRADKLRVVQYLVTEIAEEEGVPTIPPGVYPIWSPYDAYEAADAMMGALAEEKANREG